MNRRTVDSDVISGRVLIADDESEIAYQIAQLMRFQGLTPILAGDGEAALDCIRSQHPDLLMVDFNMPGKNGLEVLRGAKSLDPDLPVILITGYPEVRRAVEAMRAGALDYITKPFQHADIVRLVRRGLKDRLRNCSTEKAPGGQGEWLRELLGPSEAVGRLIQEIGCVAKSNFSVILLGETGSGKEVAAQAIHRLSTRAKGPFIPVDCGAIPENLVESDLFGHERGAFTGADRQKCGWFETASGGTLFLDEISNLPVASQSKLLRVLQDRLFYPVGGTKPIPADARVIVASNLDLEQMVETGGFRRDLYFRLNEFVIRIPALRERKEDIVYLAKQFLRTTNAELGKRVAGFTRGAIARILAYSWPGNVRQLRAAVRRAVLLAGEQVGEEHLEIGDSQRAGPAPAEAEKSMPLRELVRRQTERLEREVIAETLRRTSGNKAKAARWLQVDYKTIHNKVKEYGILTNGADEYVEAEQRG